MTKATQLITSEVLGVSASNVLFKVGHTTGATLSDTENKTMVRIWLEGLQPAS